MASVTAADPSRAREADHQSARSAAADLGARPFDPGLRVFGGVLLAYVVLMAVLATLCPFEFVATPKLYLTWWFSGSDVALNLVLLLPAGFLWRLTRAGRGHPLCLDALGLGLALSTLLELAQMYLPGRFSSPVDVVTNGLGAWAGAAVHARLHPWLERRLRQQLSLHLPLANLLYLVLPLCSLDALCLQRWQEALSVFPLATFTAWIAAALYKHRLLGGAQPFAFRYSLAIGVLFSAGYLPAGVRLAPVCPLLLCATTLLTRATIAAERLLDDRERRFVVATIRRALPWYVAYLVVLGCRAWFRYERPDTDAQLHAMGLLRDAAAFTLLGYLVSELYARSGLSLRAVVGRAGASGLTLGALVAALHVRDRSVDALITTSLLGFAAVGGAAIHRVQLRLVRSWGHSLRPGAPRAA